MDLLKLKYFYTVAKLGHVTRASELLHVAQPAITKTIKGLESELGITLFKKQGRNIVLTEQGMFLKERLDGVFLILDNLPDDIERLKRKREKTIKLNVLSASIFIMESVMKYKNIHPDVVFNMFQFAESGNSDINITTDTVSQLSLKSTPTRCVIEEKIYIAVSKRSKFANCKSITLSELKDQSFVYIAGSKAYKQVCDSFFNGLGFLPKIGFETDSPIVVKNIIGADAGIGFWPERSWGDVHDANVKLIPVTDVDLKRNVIIEYNDSEGGSQAAKEFYDYLTSELKKRITNKI